MTGKRYRPPTVGSLAARGMDVELWCGSVVCLHNVAVSAKIIAASIGPKALVSDASKGYRCPRCGDRNTVAMPGPPSLAELFINGG